MEDKKIKVFLVNVGKDNRIRLRTVINLAFPDSTIIFASGDKKGLELAAAKDPDVILIDRILSGMQSFDFCRLIKEHTMLCHIPVVCLTAVNENKEFLSSALESGADAFLSVPIDVSELTVLIRSMLKVKRANTAENLRKLNHVYKFSSNITKVIIHALDSQMLFNEACQIALNEGGFLMAWIGIVNPVLNKVEVAASGGKTGEYLNNVSIDLNNPVLSSGPTGLAVKSGKSVFSNNIETDARMIPWQNNAAKLGYRSSIALPLIVKSEIIGAFTLYSGEADFFREEEIKLLNEMAYDISFALEFIDIELERKRLHDDLSENVTRLELAMQSAKMAWWEMDIASGKVIFDKHKPEMLGYLPENFKHYSDFVKLVHPEDHNRAMDAMKRHLDGLVDKYEVEYRILDYSGEYKWFYDIGSIIKKDAKGIPQKVAGLVIDITNRKLTEEKLWESEHKFQKIYQNGPFGMAIIGSDFRFVSVNPTLTVMLGYTEQELQKFTFKDVTHPDDLDVGISDIYKLIKKEISILHTEKRYIRKDGRFFWAELTVTSNFDNRGQFLYNLSIVQDISVRKQAEADRFESEERYRAAFTTSPDSININTMEGKFVDVNEGFTRLSGYTREEVTGKFSLQIQIWSDPNDRIALIKHLEKSGSVSNLEFTFRHKDGSTRDCLMSACIIALNNVPHILSVTRDITAVKQAEKKIREKDIQFRKLSANVHDLIFQFTRRPDGTYFVPIASEGIRNIFGCSPEDVLDDFTPIGRVIYPEDSERVISDIEYSAKHMTYFTCEFRVQIPGRPIQWIYSKSTPEKLADGSITWYGFYADITKNKIAELEIIRLNERISTATHAAHLGIWDWDIVNNRLEWDDQMYHLYGVTKNQFSVVYQTWLNGIYPDDRARCDEETNQALTGGFIYDTEFRVLWPDGSIHYLKADGDVFLNKQGEPVRMVGVNYDITLRKNSESEIKQLNETLERRVLDRTAQLETANQEMEAFAYSVSHDLQAPLRHIKGFMNLFLDTITVQLSENEIKYLSKISASVNEMGDLIDALLSFFRLATSEVTRSKIDSGNMVHHVLRGFKEEISSRNIAVTIGALPDIVGDNILIRQVWINLISNAVKYTAKKANASIQIGSLIYDDETVFYVKDNGAGFNMKYASKLFGVFQRLHKPRDFEGIGIGLATVGRIVSRHHGRYWAEGEVGQGAAFYFSIPGLPFKSE